MYWLRRWAIRYVAKLLERLAGEGGTAHLIVSREHGYKEYSVEVSMGGIGLRNSHFGVKYLPEIFNTLGKEKWLYWKDV